MSNNVVDILRDKTDEADLDQVLKSQMGGYTKKSVQDYFARIKRQQQQTTQAFNRDMQALLEDKEKLQAENSQLKNRLTKVVTDYKMLSNQMASMKAGETMVTMEDVVQLRGHVRVLEKDKQEMNARLTQAAKQNEQKQHTIGEKNRMIDQLKQESVMYQQMLSTERTDKEGLQKTVSAQASEIDRLQGEVAFLKAIVSDGNVAQLNTRIDELTGDLQKLNGELEIRAKEQKQHIKRIDTLTQQENTNHKSTEELRASLEQAVDRNEKMEAENKLLHGEVERYMKEALEMIRTQSDLRVQIAILSRKLDAEKLRNIVNPSNNSKK